MIEEIRVVEKYWGRVDGGMRIGLWNVVVPRILGGWFEKVGWNLFGEKLQRDLKLLYPIRLQLALLKIKWFGR